MGGGVLDAKVACDTCASEPSPPALDGAFARRALSPRTVLLGSTPEGRGELGDEGSLRHSLTLSMWPKLSGCGRGGEQVARC